MSLNFLIHVGKCFSQSQAYPISLQDFKRRVSQGRGQAIPYSHTLEVTNSIKGLDLLDRVPEELWTEVRVIVQEAIIKTIPKKTKCKKAKWLSEEVLQTAVKRRESESEFTQSCPTLCDPIDCSLPGSSVHGIFQARVLEWVAISFSRRVSQPRD